MIIDDNQNDLLRSMGEVNSYYKKAINKLQPWSGKLNLKILQH